MRHNQNAIASHRGFSLWKYGFQNHPLREEREIHRKIYAQLLMSMLKQATNNHPVCLRLMDRLHADFVIAADNPLPLSLEMLCQRFSERIFWHGGLRFGWRDYRPTLLLEYAFLTWAFLGKVDDLNLCDYAQALQVDSQSTAFLCDQIPNIFLSQENMDQALRVCPTTDLASSFAYLKQALANDYRFCSAPRYRVVICATMSSGKSTLINALLGTDSLPSCHQACTGKIISLENDWEQPALIGCKKLQSGGIDYAEAENAQLEEWNLDADITELSLVGKMVGIPYERVIVRLYDTPGTNNAQDACHAKLTKEFLANEPLHLLIYMIDAEHPGTTDEAAMLQWIRDHVQSKGTEVLFVVNKLDTLDEEQEHLPKFLEHIQNNLRTFGYSEASLLPISANAARLFRMALAGKELSRRDGLRLKELYCHFMEDGLDLRSLAGNRQQSRSGSAAKDIMATEGHNYEEWDLPEAIERTGITILEALLRQKSEEALM